MTATDVEGDTRFSAALDQARQIINSMNPQDTISLIRVADLPEPLTSYTADKNELRRALEGLTVSQGRADWDTALTLAAAGAAGAEHFSIVMISDGGGWRRRGAAREYPAADLSAGGRISEQHRHHCVGYARVSRSATAALRPSDQLWR